MEKSLVAFKRIKERDVVRHFVLGVIADKIKKLWRSLPPAEQLSFQNGVLDLLHYLRPTESEVVFVKEKLGMVIVEVAKRQWPQRWPTFADDLVNLCRKGLVQMEVVAKVGLLSGAAFGLSNLIRFSLCNDTATDLGGFG